MMAKGKYQEWLSKDKLILLEGWARDGLTDEQIACKIGINKTTLYDWRKKHPNISNSLKKGKEVADYEVENALFKRATGYDYEETQQFVETKDSVVKKKVVKTAKHIPPDTLAIIYWLKNRKSEKWRDRPENSEVTKDGTLAQDWIDGLIDGEDGDE